jgi:hypothetical protein
MPSTQDDLIALVLALEARVLQLEVLHKHSPYLWKSHRGEVKPGLDTNSATGDLYESLRDAAIWGGKP